MFSTSLFSLTIGSTTAGSSTLSLLITGISALLFSVSTVVVSPFSTVGILLFSISTFSIVGKELFNTLSLTIFVSVSLLFSLIIFIALKLLFIVGCFLSSSSEKASNGTNIIGNNNNPIPKPVLLLKLFAKEIFIFIIA